MWRTSPTAILFTLTALVGVWAAYNRSAAWGRFALIALGVAALLSIAWAGRRWGERVLGLAAVGCALLAAAIGAYFLLSYDWETGGAGKFAAIRQAGLWIQAHRPAVPIPEDINGNVAGGALALLLPLGTAGAVWAWRRFRVLAVAGSAGLILTLVALFLTASRGAWLGLAGGVLVAWATRWRKAEGWLLAALVIIPVGLFMAAVALPGFDRWLGAIGIGSSAVSRAQLWRDGLALLGDYPFTGGGLGMTMMVYSTYGLLLHVGFTTHFHNLFLQVAFEQGLSGLAALVVLLVIALRQAMQAASSGEPGRIYPLAAVASLSALVIHGMADAGLYVSRLVPVLVLPIGFALAVSRPMKAPPRTPKIGGLGGPFSRPMSAALAALALLVVALLPGTRAAFQANLGAVAQTRTELSVYRWPEWPVQDAVRRARQAELTPAVTRYTAALALDPRNVTANRRLGQIELSLGEYEEARQHLEVAYAAAPGQRATRQLLGESYAIGGEGDRAAALWSTVDQSQGQILLRAGWYDAIGEGKRAGFIRQAAGTR